ncbi:putative Peptidase M76 family [Trypanosoma vivax]|uniref:Mitochondrial inner membrane protease ATP23 n=1 Tax=Trypanosoma vivax (strain Y486) TaxID=1055687 RepID=G0U6Q4_TRYVY|nr:hypothetical protein TRVL_02933 [Trypanosoma vivax]KAH8611727.1 putative Peptidase M76 family [Trypanosoma vivax]CCC51558.1 conserved hypothetical protein [Trypanosoma vivax Y486]
MVAADGLDGQGNTSGHQSLVHRVCEAAVDEVLATVNTVQYIIQSIEQISHAPFRRERIKCVSLKPKTDRGNAAAACLMDGSTAAGYMWRRARDDCEKGDILLLEEHVVNPQSVDTPGKEVVLDGKTLLAVERSLRHELIHAFDDVRGFVEAADCSHQACSEIRAARLSGDCFVGEEFRRGRFDPLSGGMKCVRRRAIMAVDKNPLCRDFSERAVERVFQRCYSDYEPFAAPIYAMGSYGKERFKFGQ